MFKKPWFKWSSNKHHYHHHEHEHARIGMHNTLTSPVRVKGLFDDLEAHKQPGNVVVVTITRMFSQIRKAGCKGRSAMRKTIGM